MNLLETFAQDPQKLLPVMTGSLLLLLASALPFFDNGAMAYNGSTTSSNVETIRVSLTRWQNLSYLVGVFPELS